jgi:hypothetical protein
VLPHIALARHIVASPSPELPYPLLRRAQLAALPALPAESSVTLPAVLLDLGLRRWRDPQLLFAGGLERDPELAGWWEQLKVGQDQAIAHQVGLWESGEKHSSSIGADLESLIVFTGDNSAGIGLARHLAAAVRPLDTPRLAVATATMTAMDDPAEAYKLLDRAWELALTPLAQFLIRLRQVALLIKRLYDYGAARNLITALQTAAGAALGGYIVSEADAAGMEALLLNLRALIEVREDDVLTAVDTMDRAARIMPDDGFVVVSEDMADRYRAQVRINVVQTLWLAGRRAEAVQRINSHVAVTRSEHPYSLSEALLVAAYINFLGGEHGMALSYCMEAERHVAAEGTPTRLMMCRRIAAGALARLGKTRRAQILARQMVKDPLGDHRLV